MTAAWLRDAFKTDKPVIAMAHVPALPNTPRYRREGGVGHLIERLRPDVEYLVSGGVDAILFCNEDDRPYVFRAGVEQVAAMTRVVAELAPTTIPFGVDFLWDGLAAMAIAQATGASFIREVLTGLYESDMGLWSPDAGAVLRLRAQVGADHIRVVDNIAPEFASPLGSRTLAQRARSAITSSLADAILISGAMAGDEPDIAAFQEVKTVTGNVPVFLNTGAKPSNIARFLTLADGVIVGSSLKVDGVTWNPVDPARVEELLAQVHLARQR